MGNYGDTVAHVSNGLVPGKNPAHTTFDKEKVLNRTGESNEHRGDPVQEQPAAKAREWAILMGHFSDNYNPQKDGEANTVDFLVDAGPIASAVNKDFTLKWKANKHFEEHMEIVITVPVGLTLSWWNPVTSGWIAMTGAYVYPVTGTLDCKDGELLLRANVAAPGEVTVDLLARRKTAPVRWGHDSLVITTTDLPEA